MTRVARVNERSLSIGSSPFGLGGTTAQPAVDDLSDVDLTGIADGDTIIWDDATDTWVVGPGGGSSSLPWYDVVTDGGLVGDGVTDDTVALQAAIAAATSSGTCSATLYFPPGVYLIGGALQDTGDFNAQILLPEISTSDEQITLHFLGAARPPFAIHGPRPDAACYSIIISSLTGGTGTAAVFSGGNGTWPIQNNVSIVVEDLICLAPPDPSLTFWNLTTCQGGSIHNLLIYTSTWTNTTQPTNSNAYGVKLPQWGQSNYTHVDGLMVSQYYTGLLQGELVDAQGLIFGAGIVACELPFSEHPSRLVMHQTGCTYGIKVTGENRCDIWFDVEHYTDPPFPAWRVTIYDLDDGADELYGEIVWFSLDGVTQVPDHIFNVNGGANTIIRELGTAVDILTLPTAETDTTLVLSPDGAGGVEFRTEAGGALDPDEVRDAGRWEVVMVPGVTSPPDPVQTAGGDDWVYGWVPG